jgi:hypothetical protein
MPLRALQRPFQRGFSHRAKACRGKPVETGSVELSRLKPAVKRLAYSPSGKPDKSGLGAGLFAFRPDKSGCGWPRGANRILRHDLPSASPMNRAV